MLVLEPANTSPGRKRLIVTFGWIGSDAFSVLSQRPAWWPRFRSTLRSTAMTARLGRLLGIAIAILFVTGLISHY
ncbi:MAG TPA: hypothetical protein VGW74_03140, partial [Propionibacteriaceae bacterium]|nr:hypothetical protein [Propionibacteriaceae bacterium]